MSSQSSLMDALNIQHTTRCGTLERLEIDGSNIVGDAECIIVFCIDIQQYVSVHETNEFIVVDNRQCNMQYVSVPQTNEFMLCCAAYQAMYI